jgi:hypothetical protein
MIHDPPKGSKIQVQRDMHSTSYVWKNDGRSLGEYVGTAFLLFWFCGWTFGGIMALLHLMSGTLDTKGTLFFLAWLIGWVLGETYVGTILYLSLRRRKPSVLTLSPGLMRFETGTTVSDRELRSGRLPRAVLPKCRNRVYEIETCQLKSLKLDRVGERQRLTFDYGGERIEIGQTLSEPEREWLHQTLKAQGQSLQESTRASHTLVEQIGSEIDDAKEMKKEPLSDFKVEVEETTDGTTYTWKDEEDTFTKYRRVAFILMMSCAVVFFALFVLSERTPDSAEGPNWLFWKGLAIISLGGLVCICLIYSTLKPKKPFKLVLSPACIQYEKGSISTSTRDKEADDVRSLKDVMAMTKKPQKNRYDLDTSNITDLRLERVGKNQKLSLYHGTEVIEIGPSLSEPEREWLCEILRKHTDASL